MPPIHLPLLKHFRCANVSLARFRSSAHFPRAASIMQYTYILLVRLIEIIMSREGSLRQSLRAQSLTAKTAALIIRAERKNADGRDTAAL
jgi:hypothetical protein